MFDLDAYLARIRLPARPTLDSYGLAALQRAHRLAIPFENLDIRLGRGVAIDSAAVAAKLVTAGRGGYCFEQNRLFLDALAVLGFEARPILARVWLNNAAGTPPLTHTLSLVSLPEGEWIADPGFGASYAPPMPLVDGAEADAPDGARFRLAEADGTWTLSRRGDPATTDGRASEPGDAGWAPQFSFMLAEVHDADLALSNHWTATAPGTRFTTEHLVSIVLPRGFASLNGRRYRRSAGDERTEAEITDPRVYRMRLSMMFGIDLSKDEVAALGLF